MWFYVIALRTLRSWVQQSAVLGSILVRELCCVCAHPTVRDFLALYRDEYALIEQRFGFTRSAPVINAQRKELLGSAAASVSSILF